MAEGMRGRIEKAALESRSRGESRAMHLLSDDSLNGVFLRILQMRKMNIEYSIN